MSIKFKSRLDAEENVIVNNTITIRDEGAATGLRVLHNGTDGYLENHIGDFHIMGAAGSNGQIYMTLAASNSSSTRLVGIGTQTPEEVLTVAGNIQLPNQRDITWSDIGDSNTGRVVIRGNEDNDTILFKTDNSERLRITNSGLGVEQSSPQSTLHVGGNVRIDTISNLASQGLKFLIADSNGEVKYRSPSQVLSDIGAGTGGGNVSNTGTPVNNQLAIWTNATTIEGDADLTYNGTTFDINAQVDIDASGPACEITSSQAKALVVRGGNNSNNIQEWGASSNASIHSVVSTNGHFGIKTTTPGKPLDVTGTIRTSTDLTVGVVSGDGFIQIAKNDSSGDSRNSQIMFRRALEFRSEGGGVDNLMVLDRQGNVYVPNGDLGVRTSSPDATLHVDAPSTTAPSLTFNRECGQIFQNENSELAIGLSNSSPFNLWMQARKSTDAARNIALQPLGGNIGIGIVANNITEKLHVNGVVKADGGLKGYVPAFHHGGFFHSSSSSSSTVYYLPTNYIVETTSSQYYNTWTAPYDGRVKKIIMRWASGSTPQATSLAFRWAKNGSFQLTSFAGTITNAATTSMKVVKEFADTDITFSEGDKYKLGFQTNGGNRLLYGFSYTVVIEYNKD
ncbi:MAG: hypothetical protein GOVbin3171_48 [Prokaryotic dsDNA virus sp.]|nr:MAG: hypothetical protein GOVbin3171_48 [Prokaryotic dsDNA virus sp.]|tara:strand:- start:1474 stop:3339 length:1866 start_codon:yes stop_codon:yes gene_type:complete